MVRVTIEEEKQTLLAEGSLEREFGPQGGPI
jgi:hypothetical protein